MEENPVFVLFDLRGHFEEHEDQRGGLRVGQWGVSQGVGAEGMVEDISGAREQESHSVGQEGRRRGAVTVEITLDRLDIVFSVPLIRPLYTQVMRGLLR